MVDPATDPYWIAATQFVQTYLRKGDRLLAPIDFRPIFTQVTPYRMASLPLLEQVQWVILHKGMVDRLETPVQRAIAERFTPVFANEVFVIFANPTQAHPGLRQQGAIAAHHLYPLLHQLQGEPYPPDASAHASRWSLLRGLRWVKHQLAALLPGQTTDQAMATLVPQFTQLGKDIQELQQTLRKSRTLIFGTRAIATLSLAEFTAACRAACQTAYLGDGTVLCRVLGKQLMYADTQDIGITPHLCLNGFWEPGLTLAIARLLQPDWHCIDVGANHGYFTVLMADAVHTAGRVLALEPNPRLVDLVSRTLQVNGLDHCTHLVAKAASDTDGKPIQLVIPQGQTGHGSITLPPSDTHYIIPTETVTIDALTQDWKQVNLVKIDAEGAEAEIWWGMQQTIRKHNDIIVLLEFGAARYPDPRSFLQSIEAEGFVLQYVEGAAVKPISLERCLTERLESFWMLFLQRPGHESLK